MRSASLFLRCILGLLTGVALLPAVAQAEASTKINPAIVGAWQYPGHTVWITIRPDGKAFQCRVDQDGFTVYRANGKVVSGSDGDSVIWDALWGKDKITARPPGAIVLQGKHGTFHYITALDGEAAVCRQNEDGQ